MAYSNYGGGGSYTSYGAQGGDQGGGFMGGTQGGGSQGNQGGYEQETLRPLTIMQALNAVQPYPEADHKVDDVDLKQMCIVGQVRNISKQLTNVTYRLDDGTGIIDVKLWLYSSDNPPEDDMGMPQDPRPGNTQAEEGQWAKVYGRLKTTPGRLLISTKRVRPIDDYNEVTHHLLEAAFTHLYFTRGPPEQFQSKGEGAGAGAASNGGVQGGYGEQGQNGMGDLAIQKHMPNLSAAAKKVWNTLYTTPQMSEGLHMQLIAQQSGLALPEVAKGGQELMDHSLIYTTLDDNTWALLET